MLNPSRYRHLLLLLPGWVVFMAYLPALGNGFVWDDIYFLTDLPYLRDAALWWQHIREPLFVSRNYFRPLPLLSFVIEARLGGPAGASAFIFHLTNLLLHALNTTLVVLLVKTLLQERVAARRMLVTAAGAGLLFGLHPVLIETACWISDRFDLMMTCFIFLALLADVAIARAATRAITIGLLFLLALLCKETAVILLALLPLWRLVHKATTGSGWRDDLRQLSCPAGLPTWGALALALAGYLVLRHDALGVLYRSDTLIVPGNNVQHFLLVAKTLGWYGLLLFWPFGQIGPVHPGSTPIAMDDLLAWSSVVALLVLGGGLMLLLRRAKAVGLLALAALVALAPVSNYVPLTIGDNMVHDRYLILPLAFLVVAMATASATLTSSASARYVVSGRAAAGLWAALSLATIFLTVPRWESNLSLWGWAHASEPDSNIARGNYVAALANAGRNQAVLGLCDEILRDYPDNAIAMHDKALALMRLDRDDEARRYSELSLRYFDHNDVKGRLDLSEAWNLLGYLSMRAGDWAGAEKSLAEAIRLTPYLTRPHFNLAMVHYQRGDVEAGDREMEFTLRYDPPELLPIHRSQADGKRAAALARQAGQGALSK